MAGKISTFNKLSDCAILYTNVMVYTYVRISAIKPLCKMCTNY